MFPVSALLTIRSEIYEKVKETGICFKFTEASPGIFNGVIINPEVIPPDDIDEVILGNCRQAGNGPNPSRTAAVRGGIPESVPTQTINMACPSGMKAIQLASQSIRLGDSDVVLVGGFDSMSTIPYLLKNARWEVGFADRYTYWVVSDDVERNVDRLRAIIAAEEVRAAALTAPPLVP